MATAVPFKSQLRLYFIVGQNDKGEDVLKSKVFNNVKVDASADSLFAVASAVAPLQVYPLQSVERSETAVISG